MFQRQRADGILGLQAGGRTRDTTRHVRDAPETRPREPVLPPRPSSRPPLPVVSPSRCPLPQAVAGRGRVPSWLSALVEQQRARSALSLCV